MANVSSSSSSASILIHLSRRTLNTDVVAVCYGNNVDDDDDNE
jgi:hypothetical protein